MKKKMFSLAIDKQNKSKKNLPMSVNNLNDVILNSTFPSPTGISVSGTKTFAHT